MSFSTISRASSVPLPEHQSDDAPTLANERIDLTQNIEEISETQQSAPTPPPAPRRKTTYGKRKAEDESTSNSKKRAVMDMSFISGREDHNTPSLEDEKATTIEALRIRIQALEERTENNREVIRTGLQGIEVVGARTTRAENLIQQHDRKHYGAITSFRGDHNRTNGHLLALQTERDRINNALIQVLNSFIR